MGEMAQGRCGFNSGLGLLIGAGIGRYITLGRF